VRRRILFAIVGMAALAVVAFGVPLAWTIRRIEHDDALAMLQREAARAALEVPSLGNGDSIELPRPGASGVTVGVFGPDGTRVAGTGPDHADRATSAALQGRLAEYSDASTIAVGWPLTSNEQTFGAIRAGLPESKFEHRVHELWLLMSLLGLLVIGATALVARRQASRLARPVGDLTNAVRRLGDGDFVVETAPSGVQELDTAGSALSATADRLRKLVARERTFSSDVSHQLLTPLTGLRLTLENAASGTTAPDVVVGEALDSVDRLEATINELLKLARAERPAVEPIDLAPIVESVARSWNGEFAERGRPLRVDVEPDLPAALIATSAVRHILDVLLANARDHGRGTVKISASRTPGGAVLEVSDEGLGVSGDPDRVFARGAGSGHGIGLALDRSLADAEGARLTLAAPGPGPRFRLLVPVRVSVTPAVHSS
jgi:signal transduction histidine kinase